ncbi:MAG: MFS transporter [Actinomycetota bacterium]
MSEAVRDERDDSDHSLDGGPLAFDVPSRGKRAFRALRHREFRLVWSTFMVGQFGFWIAFIALQALMSRLTDADGTWLGILFFVNFFPMLIFTPIAGVVADRLDRKKICIAAYSVLSVLMTGLAVMTLTDHATPASLLPFAFGVGTVFSFNAPANHSIIANAVPRTDFPSAISLQSAGGNLSRVVGPTLAAPVLAVWGEGAAFAVYAATSVIVVFLLRRAHISGYEPEHDDGHFWSRVRRGLEHARERPPAMAVLSVLVMSSLFAASYLALLPVMADQVFDKGPTGFATLAAVAGFGSMLGALSTAFRDSMPTLRSTSLLIAAFGASIVAFAAVPTWSLALAAIVVTGLFYFSGMTTLNTLLQYLAAENMRGRISSLFVIGWAGLVPIGGLWQGLFASAYGVRTTMMLAGSVTAVYAAGVALLLGGRATRRVAVEVT